MQAVTNAVSTTICVNSPALDSVQSVPSEPAAVLDSTEASDGIQNSRDNAKLLFGNGRLDRWLSERRALHKRPKTQTLDSWLSPSKMPASLSKKSPSVARTRIASPGKSPVRLGQASVTNVNSESSDPPQSPSTDIRRYFHCHDLPRKRIKSDSSAENQSDTVTVIDLVADSPPEAITEHSSEAVDGVKSSHEEALAPPEDTVQSSSSCRRNSSSPHKTSDTEYNLEWWATSRTKSSTRKGPFKRSLGLVHFLNEVCFIGCSLQCANYCDKVFVM